MFNVLGFSVMPDYLATYDLMKTNPEPYSEFLEQATKLGWRLWVTDGKDWYRLPNTTLEGTFATRDAAVAALKAAGVATAKAIGIKVTIEKWIVTSSEEATFNSDVKQPKK
ncbi:hypothetical protein [Mesorhizobium sp. M0239]|uniref:hypothetical protein n=1 Tax=Mesorhizobium sp. M0239 TaxID=2956924 RepID=UPI00333C303B